MKRKGKILIAMILVVTMVLAGGCTKEDTPPVQVEAAEEKLLVYASFYPMYDFATKVGGDKVDVKMMVPPGVEAHDWEPTARLMGELEKADVFVYNGLEMEPWAEKLLGSVQNDKLIAVEASAGIKLLKSEEEEDHEEELEWSGVYTLEKGTYSFVFKESEDPSMNIVFLDFEKMGKDRDKAEHEAEHVLEEHGKTVQAEGTFSITHKAAYELQLNKAGTNFTVKVETPGTYITFMEHLPEEFDLQLLDETGNVIEPADAEEHGDGHHHHGEYDPHVWLSPMNAMKQAENIKNAFIQADEANQDYYEANYREFAEKLTALDDKFKQELSNVNRKEIIVAHAAFGYLADRYGLKQVAIRGISPQEEPSAAKMAEISKFAQTNDVKFIFFETLTNPKLAEVLAREVGAQTMVLNPLEGLAEDELKAGKDYISAMEDNLAALKKALGE
ncbi:metal ABC transporter solute-binding protein, Zn/Mn family [Geosporobacter ferrireducens]|uniref:ABC transporter substrate-binding protein n=1 Tax=Geosporobacter ferrireducens TaxID=1424294 RepID=A0A1D8GH25_9FIRM|nr:zinc ABC transporter substrate-binding protein [Geosporobacter ferrireducens]AOT70215.1 hypothetical protein Gferi_11790 [Geosporobacter ferrireducens]MTI53235.1 hypothetical protein [Geosporobacter ferrireducens]